MKAFVIFSLIFASTPLAIGSATEKNSLGIKDPLPKILYYVRSGAQYELFNISPSGNTHFEQEIGKPTPIYCGSIEKADRRKVKAFVAKLPKESLDHSGRKPASKSAKLIELKVDEKTYKFYEGSPPTPSFKPFLKYLHKNLKWAKAESLKKK